MSKTIRVLGLDPGIDRLGWGVVEGETFKNFRYISSGLISSNKNESSELRLSEIYDDLIQLIEIHRPTIVYAEELFFAKNVKTAMIVSEVRGVIKIAVQKGQCDYEEIHPRTLKKKITGIGNAHKKQVQYMLEQIFHFTEKPQTDDVADAIAIAYVGFLEQVSLV
jgi:crossover junction endodeoxyribonuclease RuvC